MREALHGALGRGEITVHFQPIVELEGRRAIAFEALARWDHPELGSISPEAFIPLAELTADILPIGEWIFRQAIEFVAELRGGPMPDGKVSVNVSPAQLQQDGFAELVRGALAGHGLEGDALAIEVTEGDMLESSVVQKHNLNQLRDLGVGIVLDDFGTGYSALGYLRDFAIDTIKVDRRFVERLTVDRHSAALIQVIVAMGQAMDMQIVAEGIETDEQAQILRLLGCRYGQGYLFGRPAPAGSARHLLELAPR
jgi:EAL domain-containing protein (putative c-di-GMP-specific phosphodiesterase class I)